MGVYFLVLQCALSANVDQLGDRSYRRREEAHRTLARFGRLAVPHLQKAQASDNPEVARRAALLLAPYEEELADRRSHTFLPTDWPRRPWLSLPDYGMGHYLSLARQGGSKTGPPDWPEYREATRLWVRGLLLQRRPAQEIVEELGRMAAEEKSWILRNGGNYNPPLKLPDSRLARGPSK
jgi:hypothetical protein